MKGADSPVSRKQSPLARVSAGLSSKVDQVHVDGGTCASLSTNVHNAVVHTPLPPAKKAKISKRPHLSKAAVIGLQVPIASQGQGLPKQTPVPPSPIRQLNELAPTHLSLPTPVRVHVLVKYLSAINYDQSEINFLHQGFTEGFRVNFQGQRSTALQYCENHTSASQASEIVNIKLQEEIATGRIAGPFDKPPFQHFQCSPLGLVPQKAVNEFRIIHDLSFPQVPAYFS